MTNEEYDSLSEVGKNRVHLLYATYELCMRFCDFSKLEPRKENDDEQRNERNRKI